MTAEVVILNREGVAIAADSAVTVSGPAGQKIYTTANKIFALSKLQPVGIVFYGMASLLDVPWETIIKLFRDRLGSESHDKVDGYADAFFEFVKEKQVDYFPEDAQRRHVAAVVTEWVSEIRVQIDDKVEEALDAKGVLTKRQIQAIVRSIVVDWHDMVKASPLVEGVPADYDNTVRKRYSMLITAGIGLFLGEHARSRATERILREGLILSFGRHVQSELTPQSSGIAIAGFGRDEALPTLVEFEVEGIAGDYLKLHQHLRGEVGPADTEMRAAIRPLAQSEMVYRFMEGVDPDYQQFIHQIIGTIADSYPEAIIEGVPGLTRSQRLSIAQAFEAAAPGLVDNALQTLSRFRTKYFADPVTQLVDALPKEDLAAMAEALVNLTSFKRRVSWDDETVGGPIDVAFISRGDGFIWIKRKHYFEPELNPHYFAAKYARHD